MNGMKRNGTTGNSDYAIVFIRGSSLRFAFVNSTLYASESKCRFCIVKIMGAPSGIVEKLSNTVQTWTTGKERIKQISTRNSVGILFNSSQG